MQQVNSILQTKRYIVPRQDLNITRTTACVLTPSLGRIPETNCPLARRLIFPSFAYCYASCVLGQMCKDKLSKTASEIPSAPLRIPSFVYTLLLAASNKRPDSGLIDTSEGRETEISTFKVEGKSLQLHICERRNWNFLTEGFLQISQVSYVPHIKD